MSPYNTNGFNCPKCRRTLDQYTKTLSGNMYRCPNCKRVFEIVDMTTFEIHMGRLKEDE